MGTGVYSNSTTRLMYSILIMQQNDFDAIYKKLI